jgi:hypothetical protein
MGTSNQRRTNRHKNQPVMILSHVRLEQNQLTSPGVTRTERVRCTIDRLRWGSLKILSDYSGFMRDFDRSIDIVW